MKLGWVTKTGKFKTWDMAEELPSYLSLERRRPIVWTNGVFDILHTGHHHLFSFCKQTHIPYTSSIVIVGINSDSSAKSLNKSHPLINNEMDRAIMVASLQDVDFVVIFDEPNPVECLRLIKPDYFIKGGDYTIDELPENEKTVVAQYGGEVLVSGNVEGKSNTNIWKYMETYFKDNSIDKPQKDFMEVFHNGE